MGVRGVSAGSTVMRAALGLVRRIGKEWMEAGTSNSLFDGAVPFAELNQMMGRQIS